MYTPTAVPLLYAPTPTHPYHHAHFAGSDTAASVVIVAAENVHQPAVEPQAPCRTRAKGKQVRHEAKHRRQHEKDECVLHQPIAVDRGQLLRDGLRRLSPRAMCVVVRSDMILSVLRRRVRGCSTQLGEKKTETNQEEHQLINVKSRNLYQLSVVNLSTVNCQLTIDNSQLSNLNYQFSTINYQLSILNSQLSVLG